MKGASHLLLSWSILKQLPSEGLNEKCDSTFGDSLKNSVKLAVGLWKTL